MAFKSTKRKPRPLTPAQEKFCSEYALHRNASEAYRQAYPRSQKWKPENLHLQASKLLKHPRVVTRTDQLLARVKAVADRKFEIKAERVLEELAAIAFSDVGSYYVWGSERRPVYRAGRPLLDAQGNVVTRVYPTAVLKPSSQLTPHQRAAVAGIEMSANGSPVLKLASKAAALKMLAQHLGLLADQHEQLPKHQHVHAVLEVPALEGLPPADALKSFESFRLKLAQQPALPAPQPEITIVQAEQMPAAA